MGKYTPEMLRYARAGLSVVPIRTDGSKRATVAWGGYQQQIATHDEIRAWGDCHVGIIAGKVSGGLEVVDIDSKYDLDGTLAKRWGEMVDALLPGLLQRVVVQTTMGGGYHAIYRCSVVEGNQKLAMRQTTASERTSDTDKVRVLIETRGEGGYILCCPTPGYRLVRGSLEHVPEITPDERRVILSVGRAMNAMPANGKGSGFEQTPLDDYCDHVSDTDVITLLEAHGWTVDGERGGVYRLRRPGKDRKGGISATYGHRGRMFYCFSTSTPFEAERGYTPAGVYAVLEHDGDFRVAAQELGRKGWGTQHVSAPRQAKSQEPSYDSLPPESFAKKHVVRARDCLDDLEALMLGKLGMGVSTGWPSLDKHLTIVRGQMTVVSGCPTHGKSEFVDALMVNLSVAHGWKWLVFSPENYPVAIHVDKLMEKKARVSWRSEFRRKPQLYGETIQWVDEHFRFFDATEDDINLDSLLSTSEKLIKDEALDGFVIDPWNEIDATRPKDMSETDHIGKSLMRIRKFSRRLSIATFIIAHPTKLRKKDDGSYPAPTLYDISGSSHWRNKADNGIVVYRCDPLVSILVQKVKYKYNGRPGAIDLQWNPIDGTYTEPVMGMKQGSNTWED